MNARLLVLAIALSGAALPSLLHAGAKPRAEANSIVGQWQITIDDDQIIKLNFNADGTLSIDDGSPPPDTGTYALDKSATPNVLRVTDDKAKKTTYSLCHIEGDQMKLLASSVDKKEALPKDFGEHKTMLLKRAPAKLAPPPGPDPNLIGKWAGQAEGEKLTIEFKADGSLQLQKEGDDPAPGTFTTNAAAAPAHIDLKLGEKTGKAIYKIEEGRLTMTEPKDKRARDFTAKSAFVAERVKE